MSCTNACVKYELCPFLKIILSRAGQTPPPPPPSPSLSLFPSLSSLLSSLSSLLSTYIIRQLYNKPNYQCTHVLIGSFLTLELPEVINI